MRDRRPKVGHVFARRDRDAVFDFGSGDGRRARVAHFLHDDERVQKIGGDHVGRERRVLLLENDGHDIVANVAFALELLCVVFVVGQQSGHVEHDFFVLESFVHRVFASLAVRCVEASAETFCLFIVLGLFVCALIYASRLNN